MSSHMKVVLLGDGGVGKSAFIIMFVQGHFIETYDPTIEDSFRKQIKLGEEAMVLDILDTAGQEEYSSMRDQYMATGKCFILIYAINSKRSFAEIPKLHEQLLRMKEGVKFSVVVAANKSDLPADQRAISTESGQEIADKFECKFFETSAKTGLNVENVFMEVVTKMKELEKGPDGEEPVPSSRRCVLF